MEQNIIRELTMVTNTNMKDRASLKRKYQNGKYNLMQIKVANYAREDLQQDFKPKLILLNEIRYMTTTVISPVTITHKQNSFKQTKGKLRMQKEIEEYRGEISIPDEISKGIKWAN